MDTGLRIRSVQSVSIAPARIEPAPERQTVASDLPETKAVSATQVAAAIANDDDATARDRRAALNTAYDQKAVRAQAAPVSEVVQDADTKELVFRKVSAETGEVLNQFPDEAMMRLKVYNAQVRQAELAAAATPHEAFTA